MNRAELRLTVTVGEACALLGISRDVWSRHAANVPTIRIGRLRLVRLATLDAWLAANEEAVLETMRRGNHSRAARKSLQIADAPQPRRIPGTSARRLMPLSSDPEKRARRLQNLQPHPQTLMRGSESPGTVGPGNGRALKSGEIERRPRRLGGGSRRRLVIWGWSGKLSPEQQVREQIGSLRE